MKGVIFTEFIEMMEDLMGLEFTNKVIEDARLENDGAYTAIGTYSHQDMFKLMQSLSKYAGSSQEKLFRSYGEYLFYRIGDTYAKELAESPCAFSFIDKLEAIIKMEELKLNPKAKVSLLSASQKDKNTLEVLYSSNRKMGDLIEGILAGCIGHYPEVINIERELLEPDGSSVRFILKKEQHNE